MEIVTAEVKVSGYMEHVDRNVTIFGGKMLHQQR